MDTSGKAMQTSQYSPKQSENLMAALTALAMLRGASLDTSTLKLYCRKLEKERAEDLYEALERLGELPRSEGDPAFPSVGAILSMVGVMGVARHNRERAQREGYQQQVCPKCGSLAGMIRPRGEQFRTWCPPCDAFRKIIPEDLTLTDGEWNLLCEELDAQFNAWKRRGGPMHERVDPQLDREQFRGAA